MQTDIIQAQNNFLSSRINNVHSSIMTPLMLIGGSILGIENFIENNNLENLQKKFLTQQISTIKENLSRIVENINALDMSNEKAIPINTLIENIKILLNSEITKNAVTVTTFLPDTYFLVDSQNGYTFFILSKLLLELINEGNKKINIIGNVHDNKLHLKVSIKNSLHKGVEMNLKSFIEFYTKINFEIEKNSYKLQLSSFNA